MERFNLTKKRVIGFVWLIVGVLTFIFSCLKSSLPLGSILAHTFGYLTYPLAIIASLCGLAGCMGFSYTRDKKATTYFCLAALFLALVIHSINVFSGLEKVVGFSSLTELLSSSYKSMSVFGSFGSLVAGLFAILLGEMGSIVVFGIMTTLFIGLFIDYNFYGKYEPSVKKLKGHKLRERVQNSDKQRTASGKPTFSYTNSYRDEDIIDEISAEENEIKQSDNINYVDRQYTADDIVDEINIENNEPYDMANKEDEHYHKFANDDDKIQSRRKFISDTFGNFDNEEKSDDYGYSFGKDITDTDEDGFVSETNSTDDEIFSILNSPEEEEEQEDITFDNSSKPYEVEEPVNIDFDKPAYKETSTTDISSTINTTISQKNNTGFNIGNNIQTGFQNTSQPISKAPNVQQTMVGVRYNPPPLSLLKTPKSDKGDYSEEQNRKSMLLENVLASFNIPAKVQNIVRGPKITRYELSLPLGVSVKKIPPCESDIAAALSAKAIVIRAPIPGSQFVGIELENDTFSSVSQRELLESPEFQNAKDPLPIAIGKDISGEIVVKSLAKMVHLLIAGSTGSGKSVFIHNIILSLIYKLGPEDCRLMIIDPKKVELNCYDGLPHLLTPEVVKGSEKAINALKWCVKEMDRRYSLMEKSGYNNIEPYNKSELVKAGQFEKFPYIVIIVDELAEIMSINKKEVELCIQRLTQLARACGMHLVLATQRPSVDIISGVIKNNVPSRIAFSLQSGIDSKTILNTVGAEKLLGQGDMLFNPTGTSVMPRLQASYATDDEIKAVIDYDKKYNKAFFDQSIESAINSEQVSDDSGSDGFGGFEEPPQRDTVDSYFKTAVKLVMANGGASVSYLQRRLSIGYARAARIVDQMEDKGYIAPSTGAKLRKVLITPEQFAQDFGEDFNNFDN